MHLTDPPIRAALHRHLTHQSPGAFIRHELGLINGAVIADVTALAPDVFHGYEIKSDGDDLTRLQEQKILYGRVFTHCTLVATPKHLETAPRHLPRWWGLIRADDLANLTEVRPACPNPKPAAGMDVACLLWREEALDELRARGAARGLTKSRRWDLWKTLAAATTPAELRGIVARRIAARATNPAA